MAFIALILTVFVILAGCAGLIYLFYRMTFNKSTYLHFDDDVKQPGQLSNIKEDP